MTYIKSFGNKYQQVGSYKGFPVVVHPYPPVKPLIKSSGGKK